MAEIYLARSEGIGQFAKEVVLKRILPQYAKNEDFIEMFLHEARMAARLQHPNVVQVFDIGEADGSYFFTMEYVQGDDVRSLITSARKRGERIPIDKVIAIATGAAAGLHHAHEQVDEHGRPLAMVHRDVSPSNLMLSLDGAVKVADFGIAKTAAQVIETRTGVIKGKVSYMSPEQCKSEPLDRRSDVFALGVVLHELLTGQKLFRGDNDYAVIKKIVDEDAPLLSAVAPGPYPENLEQIVARALARDRDARYPSAQALQVDLEALAREQKLDTSNVSLAKYVRENLPKQVSASTEPDTNTPDTTPRRGPPTKSTSVEPIEPRSESAVQGELRDATQSRPRSKSLLLAGAAAVLVAIGGGVVVATRGGSEPPPPATVQPTLPGTAGTPPLSVPADAAVAEPPPVVVTPTLDAGVAAAGSGAGSGKQPIRKTTPKKVDPCKGWSRASMLPPPPGCDPK